MGLSGAYLADSINNYVRNENNYVWTTLLLPCSNSHRGKVASFS